MHAPKEALHVWRHRKRARILLRHELRFLDTEVLVWRGQDEGEIRVGVKVGQEPFEV